MENEQIADQILAALEALLQAAGPEWTLEFLTAGMQEASMEAGAPAQGGEMMPAQGGQMMPQGRTVGRPRAM